MSCCVIELVGLLFLLKEGKVIEGEGLLRVELACV